MESPEGDAIRPGWKKRLVYVTTTSRNLSGRFASVGTVISAENLVGVKVACPRCNAVAATIWRRFDYFGREVPLYFTKCRRCRRRRPINADEAAFRLMEAGILPMDLLHQDLPAAHEGQEPRDGGEHAQVEGDGGSVEAAEQLLANRERAFGTKHPLTFDARAQLGEAVGRSGDAREATLMYERLLVEQLAAIGHQSPAVLANRYRAAVWTANGGHPAAALVALRNLLADEERVLGGGHPNTLIVRATIAQLVAETGDREEALTMLREVSVDQVRVLGSEHPATESTLRILAEWEGE